MKKSFCGIVSFASIICFSEISNATTVEEAINAAFKNNWGWKVGGTEDKAAQEQLKNAEMAFLPSVEGFMSRSRTSGEQYKKTPKEHNDPIMAPVHENSTKVGLKLTQNIFNGFSTTNNVRAADYAAQAARYKTAVSEEELIVKVLDAYTKVWAAREKVKAMKKKEENLRKTLESQKSSLAAGAGTIAKVEEANANHQRAIFERTNAETERFSAESEFINLTALVPDEKIDLPKMNLGIPKDLKELMDTAMKKNSRIIYYNLSEQSANAELKATQGRLAPTVNLSFQTAKNFNRSREYNVERDKYRSASLEVNVPLLSNGTGSGVTLPAI